MSRRSLYIVASPNLLAMKSFVLSLFVLLTFTAARAQCDAPEVLNWHFAEADEVEIVADFPEGTSAYEIHFVALYNDLSEFWEGDSLTFGGTAASGVQAFYFDPTSLVPEWMDAENYFYEVLLKAECGEGVWSEAQRFYVSPLSLRNDPSFECVQPFTAIGYLPDGAGFSMDFDIEVGAGEPAFQVDEMSILIDIGHSFNGDLSMALTSPSGTTVQLLGFPNNLFNTTGLSMYFSDGAGPVDGPVGTVAPTEPLSAFNGEVANGTWVVSVTDNMSMDDGYLFGGCFNMATTVCETGFSGKAWYDLNADGEQNSGEPAFAHVLVQNNTDSTFFFTNAAGDYVRCSEPGPVSLSLAEVPPYFSSTPAVHDVDLAQGQYEEDLNFALTPEGSVADLSVDFYTSGFDRPGFSNVYYAACTNQGNTCVDDVTLEAELDALLGIISVTGASASFTENSVTAELGTLCPTETVIIEILHSLPEDETLLGTELQSVATLLPMEGDARPDQNTSELTTVVVGAYDPNDKQVSREEIDADFLDDSEYLTYHVRFQNTGTFYAERVVVSDTIDPLLDFSTFELLGTSHAVELSNTGRMIDFVFDNIFLPDSASDPEGSQGYLRFRIKPKPGFAEGDTIANTAYIFFDFNAPIITNTVTTVWTAELGVSSYAAAPALFPNPTASVLNIRSAELTSAHSYSVYTLLGRRVKQGTVPGGSDSFSVAVDDLPSGVYLLHLEGEEAFRAVRWVKI